MIIPLFSPQKLPPMMALIYWSEAEVTLFTLRYSDDFLLFSFMHMYNTNLLSFRPDKGRLIINLQ